MDKENYFVKYSLCANSLDRLNEIKNNTADNNSKMRNAWRTISWDESDKPPVEPDNNNDTDTSAAINPTKTSQDVVPELTQATQYRLTQIDRSNSTYDSIQSIENLADFIYESLERSNGKLDINSIQNITDSELSVIVKDLCQKLSPKGIYNLCHSLCAMQIELSERFISSVCRDVLLPVIISVEESSRLLNAAVTEWVGKFPDDVQNLIFIPALNSDVKEISIILSITSGLDIQKKRAYISDLSVEVKDLKQWHILVLQDLLVANLDDSTIEKLLNLLWKKSYEFSKDKNYGKLILNILKTNPPNNLQQKCLFEEIVAIHNTIFKKLIDKILETISIV